MPSFKADTKLRSTLAPGNVRTNHWDPPREQRAYALSTRPAPATIVPFVKKTQFVKITQPGDGNYHQPLQSLGVGFDYNYKKPRRREVKPKGESEW